MVFSLTDELKDDAKHRRSAAAQSAVLDFGGQRKSCSAMRSMACSVRARAIAGADVSMSSSAKPPKGQPQYDAGGTDAHLGMTTNERLGYFGLFEDWDEAAMARDREGMVAVLQIAKFDRQAAEGIVDTTLANPAKYGF